MLLLTRMRDTALARSLLWRWSARGVWPVAFALSLLGTELLRRESLRIWALLLLVGAALMAVLAWNSSRWLAAFPVGARAGLAEAQLQVWRRRCALATLAGFPGFLRGNCSAGRSMDRICGRLAARKREMDNDRGRGRRAADIGIRQYQLLFLQVLRGPGEFAERALQSCAETVRGAAHAKPLHGDAWASLQSSSRGSVAVSL